jgi:hypothetical protein
MTAAVPAVITGRRLRNPAVPELRSPVRSVGKPIQTFDWRTEVRQPNVIAV